MLKMKNNAVASQQAQKPDISLLLKSMPSFNADAYTTI